MGFLAEGNNGEYIFSSYFNSGISGNKTVAGFGQYDTWIGKLQLNEVLGLSSSSTTSSFMVYPNPVKNTLSVTSDEIIE